MASILVLGAGLNGLSAALVLARDGHRVTVLERDPQPPVDRSTTEAAGAAWDRWERRGVTQFRLLHLMLPRWCRLVEDELPDVLDDLVALGAPPLNLVDSLPTALTGGRRDGDERFGTFAARRPVLETAFAHRADAHQAVTVHRGVAVTGLLAEGGRCGPPHIEGVLTAGGETIRADLVIDASGRRSPIARWLEAVGCAPPAEHREPAGFTYYARYFRARDGVTPETIGPMLQHHESVSILTLPADNGTWGVGFVAAARDRALRALRDVPRWEAALRAYPTAAHWADGEPLTGVEVMAGLEDRRRRFVVDDAPVVTGLVAVGDSWACTNPSLGRGASIGMLHVCALRDVLREVDLEPGTRHALVRRFDAVSELAVAPYYDATVQFDRHRLAEMEADVDGCTYEPEDPSWAIAKAMEVARGQDPDCLRAWLTLASMLGLPEEVLAAPGLLDRIIDLGAAGPRYPLAGTTRDELLSVLGTTPTAAARAGTGPVGDRPTLAEPPARLGSGGGGDPATPDPTSVVEAYGEAWNVPDQEIRRSLLERAWSDDGVYCDPTATVAGRDALAAHIEGFRASSPGAQIEFRTGIDRHGRHFRFGWAIVDGSGDVLMSGVDFGRLADDGRIDAITGFFGADEPRTEPRGEG